MKIKFTKDATAYLNGYTPTSFAAGDVVELEDVLAKGIISEGHAVEASDTGAAPAGAPAEGGAKTPEQMTKAELAAYAEEQGITLDATKTKAEMLAEYAEQVAAKAKS